MLCTALLAACGSTSSSNPAQPSGATGSSTGSSLTSSVIAPRPVTPTNAAQVRNADQPVVLTVSNGVVTNGTGTYTFEVATDSAFSNKVQVKDGVTEGPNGQTSVKLDTLAAAADYYWHAREQGGGTTGLFGPTFKFTVGPAIVLQAPSPISPASGSVSAGWPTLTVADAARSGPAGTLTYRFDIATDAGFSNVILSGLATETPNVTSYTAPAGTAAPPVNTLYWRAVAVDQTNGVTSPATPTWSFIYSSPTRAVQIALQEGAVLWPGTQPTGSGGHIVYGNGWGIGNPVSFTGVVHTVPTIEELRVVDLLDRGMDPNSAIAWMNANGYPTAAVYYSVGGGVIGFEYEYMALVDGAWSLVVRVGG